MSKIENLTVAQIVENLVAKIETEILTPYAIHNILNGAFEILGSAKRVRPQMMYNYDKNGLIKSGKRGVKQYSKAEAQAFAIKYVTKHSA